MKGSFFCEACGAEVKGRSDRCPSCGRSFLGIRCPRCGREGDADLFVKGCPDCGYMAEVRRSEGSDSHSRPSWNSLRSSRHRPSWPASRYWVLSALIVIGVLAVLYIWLR